MGTSIKSAMGVREWLMLIVLSVFWGGSFFFVGVALKEMPVLSIVALRVGLAGVLLWAFALMTGLRPPGEWRVWRAFLIMGLLNNVLPFSLIAWGQLQVASGLASILNAATPIFTVLVAGLLLPDERITPLKLAGVGLGFSGVVVMLGVPALGSGSLLAQLAIVAATLSYALAGVYGRRFKAMSIHPVIGAAGQVSASAIVLAPIAFVYEGGSCAH